MKKKKLNELQDNELYTSVDSQIDRFILQGEKTLGETKKYSIKMQLLEDETAQKKLDVNHFAEVVYRLMMHHDTLLEIKETIKNRARKFVVENYDEQTAKNFDQILNKVFDQDSEDLDYTIDAPAGNRAGPDLPQTK